MMKLEVPIYCMAVKSLSTLLANKIVPNLLTQEGNKSLTRIRMILTQKTLSRYRASQGYVYLVHAVGTDLYKAECSVNPAASLERLKQLSPYPLQIVQCFWTPDRFADEKWFRETSFFSSLQQQCNAFCFGLTGRQLNDVLGLRDGGDR